MIILVVGFCGSMGKRRVRCLKRLGHTNISGFDISEKSEEVAQKIGISQLKDIRNFSNGVVVLSTPPKHHVDLTKQFLSQGCHVFCEASVVPNDRHHYEEISTLANENQSIFFPSATIRFKQSVTHIKKNMSKIGRVHSYDYRCAGNLRDWHPWQDIKDYYVSDPITGAGREIAAFELGWLTWLFGIDAKIHGAAVMGLSEIADETGIDDLYSFLIEHSNEKGPTQGSATIDVFSHKPYRVLRIIGEEGNIEFDWVENYVRTYDENGKLVDEYVETNTEAHEGYNEFSTERMYDDELRNFFDAIQNNSEPDCNLSEDYKVLELVEKIELIGGSHSDIHGSSN